LRVNGIDNAGDDALVLQEILPKTFTGNVCHVNPCSLRERTKIKSEQARYCKTVLAGGVPVDRLQIQIGKRSAGCA
jgi:hypothetical protein